MRRVVKKFEVVYEYPAFEGGEKVTYMGKVYEVEEMHHPIYAGDEAVVYLMGLAYPVPPEELRLAEGETE